MSTPLCDLTVNAPLLGIWNLYPFPLSLSWPRDLLGTAEMAEAMVRRVCTWAQVLQGTPQNAAPGRALGNRVLEKRDSVQ